MTLSYFHLHVIGNYYATFDCSPCISYKFSARSSRKLTYKTTIQFGVFNIHSFIHTYTTFCPHFALPMALFSSIDFFSLFHYSEKYILHPVNCSHTLFSLFYISISLSNIFTILSIRSNILKICFKCRFIDCYQIEHTALPKPQSNNNSFSHFNTKLFAKV